MEKRNSEENKANEFSSRHSITSSGRSAAAARIPEDTAARLCESAGSETTHSFKHTRTQPGPALGSSAVPAARSRPAGPNQTALMSRSWLPVSWPVYRALMAVLPKFSKKSTRSAWMPALRCTGAPHVCPAGCTPPLSAARTPST